MNRYDLKKKIIAYVNEDTHNLNIMTCTKINYKLRGIGFGGKFLKNLFWACQYATMDEKNLQRFKICTYQDCTMGFSKMCSLDPKNQGKEKRME